MCITINHIALSENHDYALVIYESHGELMFGFEMLSCCIYRVDMSLTPAVMHLRTWSLLQFKS